MAFIRDESPSDAAAVRNVHELAFGQPQEAHLVEALRAAASPLVSLVAEVDGEVIGHILFSPVTIEPAVPDLWGMGLAPLAVLPRDQRKGVGSELVRAGIEDCRRLEQDFIVVLGHALYYPRFGFVPASTVGLRSEYPVPDDVFMALELRVGALGPRRGLVKYRPEFAAL
jgi:putative acetyltransferase